MSSLFSVCTSNNLNEQESPFSFNLQISKKINVPSYMWHIFKTQSGKYKSCSYRNVQLFVGRCRIALSSADFTPVPKQSSRYLTKTILSSSRKTIFIPVCCIHSSVTSVGECERFLQIWLWIEQEKATQHSTAMCTHKSETLFSFAGFFEYFFR